MTSLPVIRTFTIFVLLVASAGAARADASLRLEGIPGEVTTKTHAHWIAVTSVNYAASVPESTTTRASGRPHFEPITIEKPLDTSSPKLVEALAKGSRIASATIDFTRNGSRGEVVYYRIELTNVVITGYSLNAPAGSTPTENVKLGYAAIKVSVWSVDPRTGAAGAKVEFQYDTTR